MQVYLEADLLKSEGDVLRDAERALMLARGRLLDSYSNVEAAADLVWDEVQVLLAQGPSYSFPFLSLILCGSQKAGIESMHH